MPSIKVNGQSYEVPAGKKLLEVLVDLKITVPYYCWHPGLKPHGNCRMCLVKVSNSRKLEVSCMWPVTDGLEVTTEGPEVDAARKGVLEYMLINHPLDCPICDKAGECMLQDHTFNYRKGVSRFQEDKVLKGTWDLGPNVRIWGNRCISCTRCVRFCEDVAGTGELSITQRGDHSVADVHPDVPLDNPMSLNTVDICPVGALIDKNFMYQARVWFADRKETVCGSCSRGCNVTATVHKGELKRLQPRHNAAVNDYWMCDAGRLNTKYVTAPSRLTARKGTVHDLVAGFEKAGAGKVAILASTYATVEELSLVEKLSQALGARVAFLTKTEGTRWVSKSGFAIEVDKTPNTKGAEQRFGAPLPGVDDVVRGIRAGEIRGLLVMNGIPDLSWPAELVDAAKGLSFLAVSDLLDGPLVAAASVVIPSTSAFEKEGTWVNRDGRLQRVRAVVPAPGEAVAEVTWLQQLLVAMGQRQQVLSTEGVFRQAMPGLDYKQVGSLGVVPGAASDAEGQPADGTVALGAK
jgi:NADH-quinone oxidoreductase subunit G